MIAYILSIPERSQSVRTLINQLLLVECIDEIALIIDRDHTGLVWNRRRAHEIIRKRDTPCLLFEDDARIIPSIVSQHLPHLVKHCSKDVGMISLFCPPQKKYDELREKGFHGIKSEEFLWAQMILIQPSFAGAVNDCDEAPEIQPYYTEKRYVNASKKTGMKIITLTKSLAWHDISVKSTWGTPAKVGGTIRDTRCMATSQDDFSLLNLKLKKFKQ
tara:strand:- start:4957 stop:5607 length:651 start_codon:yes stop_codon:yes gene_type:complete